MIQRQRHAMAFCAAGLCLSLGTAGPAQAPAHRVPYRLTETQHLLVRARINGKGPFHFILDTGAPAVFISKAAAAQAGVTAGSDGWGKAQRFDLDGGLALGEVTARIDEPPQLTGMNAMGLAGARLDGVFGYSLLARYRLEFDLAESEMSWTRLDYQPPPLQTLQEITGGKPVEMPGAGAVEVISKLAGMLLRRPPREVAYRGHLGLELRDTADGPKVAAVTPAGPSAQAGLRPGDRLLQVGTVPPVAVNTSADVLRLAAAVRPGAEVIVLTQRGKDRLRLAIRAGKEAL